MTKRNWIAAIALATTGAIALTPLALNAQGMGFGGKGGAGAERPAFETLDTDGDGNITIAEMRAQGTARFNEADADGNGVLSKDEMVAMAAARAAERAEMMISRMIEWRDTDGDGALSLAEMPGDDLGPRIFERADVNDDGMISKEEYDQMAERGGRGERGERGERGGRMGDHKHGDDHGDHGQRGGWMGGGKRQGN